jgi:hypothetical protein
MSIAQEVGPRGGTSLRAKQAEEFLFVFWLVSPTFKPTGTVWAPNVQAAANKVKGGYGRRPHALFPVEGWGDESLEQEADRYNKRMRGEKVPRKGRKRGKR